MSRIVRAAMGALIGAIAGYGWHRVVGCRTGGCPITGNPYISAFYGATVGLLIGLG